MSDNPLVAEAEGPSATSGTFLVDDVTKLAGDLANGSWKSGAMLGVTTAIDLAATVSDPIGSLIAAGLGWLMDHLSPLKDWLNDLTGNAGEVEAFARTWENVAARLSEESQQLARRAATDLSHMEGPAVEAYLEHVRGLSEHLEALAKASEGVGGAISAAAMMVDIVHGIVRDVLAQVVGSLISYAAEEVFSLGLATPLVVEQATTRVSEATARVSNTVRDLVSSVKALEQLIAKLDHAVGEIREVLDHIHPDAARNAHVKGWLERSPGGDALKNAEKYVGRHRVQPERPTVNGVVTGAVKAGTKTAVAESPYDVVGEEAAGGAGHVRTRPETEPEHAGER